MTLPEFLENERKKRGYATHSQFAKGLKIHQTQLSRLLMLEPGKLPRTETLKKLAEKLGVDESELLAYCNGTPATPEPPKHHGLQYGNCYELIDLSKKIHETNPNQEIYTTSRIAKILCEQDKERYSAPAEYAGEASQWAKIFDTFPDSEMIFFFVRETDGKRSIEIAGDWSFVFFRTGTVQFNDEKTAVAENTIHLTSVPSMTTVSGPCDVVILNLSLANRFNERKYTSVMLETFVSRIRETPDDIKIINLYVNVYERDFQFYADLGFERVPPDSSCHEENHPVLYKMKGPDNNKDFKFPGRKEHKDEIP